jgi:hypothetical protein
VESAPNMIENSDSPKKTYIQPSFARDFIVSLAVKRAKTAYENSSFFDLMAKVHDYSADPDNKDNQDAITYLIYKYLPLICSIYMKYKHAMKDHHEDFFNQYVMKTFADPLTGKGAFLAFDPKVFTQQEDDFLFTKLRWYVGRYASLIAKKLAGFSVSKTDQFNSNIEQLEVDSEDHTDDEHVEIVQSSPSSDFSAESSNNSLESDLAKKMVPDEFIEWLEHMAGLPGKARFYNKLAPLLRAIKQDIPRKDYPMLLGINSRQNLHKIFDRIGKAYVTFTKEMSKKAKFI